MNVLGLKRERERERERERKRPYIEAKCLPREKSSFPLETAKVSACEKKRDDDQEEEEEEEMPTLRGGI